MVMPGSTTAVPTNTARGEPLVGVGEGSTASEEVGRL